MVQEAWLHTTRAHAHTPAYIFVRCTPLRHGGAVLGGAARWGGTRRGAPAREEGVVMKGGTMLLLWIRWSARACTSDADATFPPTTPARSAGTPLVENLARSADCSSQMYW